MTRKMKPFCISYLICPLCSLLSWNCCTSFLIINIAKLMLCVASDQLSGVFRIWTFTCHGHRRDGVPDPRQVAGGFCRIKLGYGYWTALCGPRKWSPKGFYSNLCNIMVFLFLSFMFFSNASILWFQVTTAAEKIPAMLELLSAQKFFSSVFHKDGVTIDHLQGDNVGSSHDGNAASKSSEIIDLTLCLEECHVTIPTLNG